MDDDVLTNPIELGEMVETAVYKHVAAFYYQRAAVWVTIAAAKKVGKSMWW